MKSLVHIISIIAFFILSAAACEEDSMDVPAIAELNKQFNIAYNQEISVKNEDLKIRFSQVNANSLCPEDVQCVWQGKLVITIKANNQDLELSIGDQSNSTNTIGGYKVTLLNLVAPVLKSDENTELSDYVVTLMVEPA
ncbi:hypothetical protein [Reichenbachiella sp. MALMAid0571]|uniref:hypothetical protein n=1 Tax=Reichenbachiella sp. MALMAid0571 TaxID=3143939 RepID=UPI0032DEA257